MNRNEQKIMDFVKNRKGVSSKEIFENAGLDVSYATIKRLISDLQLSNFITTTGKGRATKYLVSPAFEILFPINIEEYYEKEIDERTIKENFNFNLIDNILSNIQLFTENELNKLGELQEIFSKNISQLSETEYKKEIERLAIDLSWKSSQIEGNTYSLLETEKLLKEKQIASGKTKDEAIMLLNHKEAIDFVVEHPDYLHPLSISKIEDIHKMLTKELSIEQNLRKRRIGISGTNYKPLDNEFQINEALLLTCKLINSKENVFEKSLLALLLISYIQPFVDGNKRTARIVSNAILMNYKHCPLSFRTVDSIDYKKAMLLFYEQNNVSNFKQIFIEQYEFAVNTYF